MKSSTTILIFLAVLVPAASAQWSPVPQPPDSFQGIEILYPGDDRIYAGTFNGRVFGSTDHGDTWIPVADGLPEADYAVVGSMVIIGDWFIMSRFGLTALDPRNFRSRREGGLWSTWEALPHQGDTFYSTATIGDILFVVREGTSLHRTDDFGTTWTPVAAPGASDNWRIFAHGSRLFAAEQVVNDGAIHRSDDLGATWTVTGASIGSSMVLADVSWQGRLLIGVHHGDFVGSFWTSPDLGDTWEEITTLPTGNPVAGLAVAQDGRLAAGITGGIQLPASIWLTADLAAWEDYTGDLPPMNRPIRNLVAQGGWFFKIGNTNTEHRAPQPAVSSVGGDAPGAPGLRLTAHPNPFNPRTTFSYTLDHPGEVTLKVADLRGRTLRSLESGHRGAGERRVAWDGQDEAGRRLPSGTYLVRLEVDGQVEIRSVTLVK